MGERVSREHTDPMVGMKKSATLVYVHGWKTLTETFIHYPKLVGRQDEIDWVAVVNPLQAVKEPRPMTHHESANRQSLSRASNLE